MKTPKINIDQPGVTDEQARKHMDFDKVLAKQAALAKPSVKPWKFWAGGVAGITAIVITTVLLLQQAPETAKQQTVVTDTEDSAATETAVRPPLAELDIPFETYTVAANEAQDFFTASGSHISIPANGFMDKDGQPLEGEVTLKYREFHTPADFFVSGIPMTYDSAGTTYHFESAGMFELQGLQGDQPVHINPDAPMTVQLASYQEGEQFNIYQLNEKTGIWDYKEKDHAGFKSALTPEEFAAVVNEIATLGPEAARDALTRADAIALEKIQADKKAMPTPPKKADDSLYNLQIAVDKTQFPEIAVYRDVLFEISKENEDFDPAYAEKDWDDVRIEKKDGQYLLTFIEGIKKYTFSTQPVLIGNEYETARTSFEAKFASSKQLLEEKEAKLLQRQKEINQLLLKADRQRENLNRWAEQQRQMQASMSKTEALVTRTFQLSAFGIWNSDCPTALPKGRMFAATFLDEATMDTTFKPEKIFLVEKGKNAMYTIYANRFETFQYDPTSINLMWVVAPDEKLMVYTPERFESMDKTWNDQPEFTFKMKKEASKIDKLHQIKQLLNI